MPEYHEVFRDDRVHVLSEKCGTCIFHPGNLMDLDPGRVKRMVTECLTDPSGGGNIPCHKTIRRSDGVRPAICRGFFDAYADRVAILSLARNMDLIAEDE